MKRTSSTCTGSFTSIGFNKDNDNVDKAKVLTKNTSLGWKSFFRENDFVYANYIRVVQLANDALKASFDFRKIMTFCLRLSFFYRNWDKFNICVVVIYIMLDSISSPSAICSPAPYMKSIGLKSAVCSPNRKAMPVTGAVTGHTVQIPHIGSDIPASNTYAWSQGPVRKSDPRHFPCINIDGRERKYPVVRTIGSQVSISITPPINKAICANNMVNHV